MGETEMAFASRSSRMTAHSDPTGWDISDGVVFGSAQIARRVSACMVVIASTGAKTALLKSKQRDFIPTVCITDLADSFRKMSLFWGVIPVLCPTPIQDTRLRTFVNLWAESFTQVKSGSPYIIITDTEVLPGIHDSVLVAKTGPASD